MIINDQVSICGNTLFFSHTPALTPNGGRGGGGIKKQTYLEAVGVRHRNPLLPVQFNLFPDYETQEILKGFHLRY